MKHKIALFGYPLTHSISPAFQQAALDHVSFDARYEARPTTPDGLADEVERLRGPDHLGANVTIPHKERVRAFLDGVDRWAEMVGAVNTIVNEGGRLVGHNTDGYGFLRSLEEKAGFSPAGKSALMLGAGGAARAAVFALAERGVDRLVIANRTLERAADLAAELAGGVKDVEAVSLRDAGDAARSADLVVNATSMGMTRGPGEGLSPMDSRGLNPGTLVFDMVYTPQETPLTAAAKRAGARALGGLWMLVYQGAAAFEKWTSKKAPVDVMYQAGLRALGGGP